MGTFTPNKELIRMEKNIINMGLISEEWKTYNELLARANKEQIEKMILLAAVKLPNKTISVEQNEN